MSIAELSKVSKEPRISLELYIEQLGGWKCTEEDIDFEYVLLRVP